MNLAQLKLYLKEYQGLSDRLYEIENKIECVRTQNLSNVTSTKEFKIVEKRYNNYISEKDRIIEKMNQREMLIDQITDNYDKTLVEYKYLYGKTFSEIADELDCSVITVKRHIDKCLEKFCD